MSDSSTSFDNLRLEFVCLNDLQPHPDNPRKHPPRQIKQIAKSIEAFGFRFPVLIDERSRLIAGHARVEACKQLGIDQVPVLRASDLSDAQVRGLMIADNRLTEVGQWDDHLLGQNLKFLTDLELDFDTEGIGFDYGEIEQRITQLESAEDQETDDADATPDTDQIQPVSPTGESER